ncbi:MAG: BatA domain-containing protein, partial [Bacteroidales bacterium]|nr:BatA domain-containing protein [Bacteroidales bacterium]
MLNFEHREYLLLAFILPLLFGLYLLYHFIRKRDVRKIGNPELLNSLMPDYSFFRNFLKFMLLLLAMLLIIIAISGPRFGSKLS